MFDVVTYSSCLVFRSQVQQQQPPRPKTLDSLFASIRNNTQQVAPVFNAHQGGRRRGGGRGGAGRGAFKTAYVWECCHREMLLSIALGSTWQCFLRALVKWLVKYLLWPLQETILAHGLHLEVPSLFDQCSLAFVPVVFLEISVTVEFLFNTFKSGSSYSSKQRGACEVPIVPKVLLCKWGASVLDNSKFGQQILWNNFLM